MHRERKMAAMKDTMMRVALDPRKLGYLIDEAKGGFALLNLLAAFVALRIYCWMLLAETSLRRFTSLP